MNDFTKEELEDIENALGWLSAHSEIVKLMIKVRSMIDNYDEHQRTIDYSSECYCPQCDKTRDDSPLGGFTLI